MIKKIRVVVFFIAIAAVPVFLIFAPQKTVSYNENKILASMPSISSESWLDRSFAEGFKDYLSDHFPLREQFIALKNAEATSLGDFEVSGVIRSNGRLIELFRLNDSRTANTESSISAISSYAKNHENVVFALIPTAQEIYSDTLPGYANFQSERDYINNIRVRLPDVLMPDFITALSDKKDDYIYYRTDHHWTEYGAYYGYLLLCENLGMTPLDIKDFAVTEMSNSFEGTLYSKTLDKTVLPDVIYNFTPTENPPPITLMSGKEERDSLYFPSYLNEKDKYSYYLGSNKGIVTVTNQNAASNDSLLVFKDSYMNSLMPFLSLHYKSIVCVDLRYTKMQELQSLDTSIFSQTLFLYNCIGFSDESTVSMLKFIS